MTARDWMARFERYAVVTDIELQYIQASLLSEYDVVYHIRLMSSEHDTSRSLTLVQSSIVVRKELRLT
jgi:hypothetical protein